MFDYSRFTGLLYRYNLKPKVPGTDSDDGLWSMDEGGVPTESMPSGVASLISGKYTIGYTIFHTRSEVEASYYGKDWADDYVVDSKDNPTTFVQAAEDAFQEIVYKSAHSPDQMLFQEVANISFAPATVGTTGIMTFGQVNGKLLAPDNTAINVGYSPTNGDMISDIWINTLTTSGPTGNIWTSAGATIDPGEEAYKVLLEEITNALGVDVYTSDHGPLWGFLHPIDWLHSQYPRDSDLNNQQYSLTSFNHLRGMETASAIVAPSGLQMFDIAALQEIYGRNYTNLYGDTFYTHQNGGFGLPSDVDDAFIYTIWDGGGTDTIDAMGYADYVVIDLRQGHFSSIGKSLDETYDGTGFFNSLLTPGRGLGLADDNVAIAFYTVIEDAVGSNCLVGDILIGNAWDNYIQGGLGGDYIYGDGVVAPDGEIGFRGEVGDEKDEQILQRDSDGVSNDWVPSDPNGSGNDTLHGDAGNDFLYGGAGNDLLEGGTDNDWLEGGDDNDTLDGDTGTDTLFGGDGDDWLYGNAGYFAGGADDDHMLGAAGDTTYYYDGGGHDVITDGGSSAGDVLELAPGFTPQLWGQEWDNPWDLIIKLGGSNDIRIVDYFISNSIETLEWSGGTIDLSEQSYTTYGTSGADGLTGLTGNVSASLKDTMFGYGGADTILAGNGDDYLDGGSDVDTLIGWGGHDVFVIDSGFDVTDYDKDWDQIAVAYNGHAPAEDSVIVMVDDPGIISIAPSAYAVQVTGNSYNNTIDGGGGNDTLDGGAGADTLIGGTGNDTLIVDNAGDVLSENANEGTDLVQTSISWALSSNFENLTLTGVSAITGTGNSGANILTGNAAASSLVGGAGNDTYVVANASNVIAENAAEGTDLVQASVSYTLTSDVENLTLTGSSNTNGTGNSGVNTITGNTGNNTLDGGAGADTMVGGTGDDTFIVDNSSDVASESASQGTDLVQASVTYTLGSNIENLTLTGSSNINGTGTATADTIIGNTGNNTLDGGGGNDTLDAGTGTDTLIGGTGNDLFIIDSSDTVTEGASAGTDTVQAGFTYTLGSNVENLVLTGSSSINGTGNTLDNALTGNSGVNTLSGSSGNDTLDGGAGADSLAGGTGNDTFVVDDAGDVVAESASEGTDLVQASVTWTLGSNQENLTLTGSGNINGTGNSSANVLTGNSGVNTLAGGAGNDTYVADNTSDVITENAAEGTDLVQASVTYTLSSEVENLTLSGSGNIDGTGNSSVNTITGNSGNNTLSGGSGADSLVGGAGNDVFLVDNSSDVASESASQGTDLVQASATYTLGSNIENLTLTGVSAINGTGNTLDNIIMGNSASNTLSGSSGNDTLDGSMGADSMAGGTGNDTFIVDDVGDVVSESASEGTDLVQSSATFTLGSNIENLTLTGVSAINGTGNASANVLTGNSGVNTLAGGAGNDTYVADNTTDVITENAAEGTDLVQASVTHTLGSEVENLTLTGSSDINGTGNSATNTLTGNSGNNALDGGGGTDSLAGGTGNDTYVLDGSDTVTENASAGTDLVQSSATYTLVSNVENLTLTGASTLNGTGNTLDNIITGNGAVNTLDGSSGNDTLDGGAGADTMIGGTGNDIFVVDDAGDVVTEGASAGTDTVQSGSSFTLASLANLENITLTGSSNIDATGNASVNILTGNSGNNTLDGGTGADTLIGGSGNDVFLVDNASDVVTENANEGTDLIQSSVTKTLSAAVENLTLTGSSNINGTGNSGVNTITGNTGNNTLDGGAGADTLAGGTGNDVYIVDDTGDSTTENASEGTDSVQAGANYTLSANIENMTLTGSGNTNGTGNSAVNTITGNSGNNTLDGSGGNDTLIGGAGDDVYVVDASDVLTEGASAGTDTVLSSATFSLAALTNIENLTLTGGSAINGTGNALNNVITGNAAVNTLTGSSGNDTLDGGAGADTLLGGTGNDLLIVDNASDVVTENSSEGTDTVQSSITWTLGSNLENLTLTGGSAITATGNSGANILTGNAAASTLAGSTGNDTYVVANAGNVIVENSAEGTDLVQSDISYTLSANVENLTLTGSSAITGTGNSSANVMTGNSGASSLAGSTGDDTYVVSSASNVVVENSSEGTDLVQASVTYTLTTNVENLTMTGTGDINATGNSAVNTLTGNGGNNTLDGGAGADTMVGGTGNDLFIVDDASDVVTESSAAGADTVQSSVTWTLASDVEYLTLTGSSGLNGAGNGQDNTLTGNSGINTLIGNGGHDMLDGSSGADTLIGGTGNDEYLVDNASDVVTENSSEGTDMVVSSVTWTLGSNVEHLMLTGSSNINATGNALDNILAGNTGINTLTGGAGNDTYEVDNASDVVVENSAEGTDEVQSDITWTLGTNFENLTLTGTSDINGTGNSVDNVITGNGGINSLSGGDGNDRLSGGAGADTLIGGSGNDTLFGGSGTDTMVGGTGDDLYIVNKTSDVVTENSSEGTDTIQAKIDWTLGSNAENLTFTGVGNIDGVGNSLDNVLTGNRGNNALSGSSGNDTLSGGDGLDSLTGGSGADIFVFEDATAWNDIDVVTDFNTGQSDVLDLRDLLSGYGSPVTNWVRITDSGGDSIVEADKDGTGGVYGWEQIATLTGITGLTDEAALVAGGNLLVA